MIRTHDVSDFRVLAFSPNSLPSKTEKKLSSFRTLPDGWNYGRGQAIKGDVFKYATILLEYFNLLGLSKTDAFPGTDGDVCLTAYRFSHYFEVNIEVDLSVAISHEIDETEVYSKDGLTLLEAKKELRKAVQGVGICGSFVLSTRDTMIEQKTGSIAWHSRSPQMVAEPPSLVGSASTIQAKPSVIIFGTFTPMYRENLQFSGNLTRPFYRTTHA